MEWNNGMEQWNGTMEWNNGMEQSQILRALSKF
jgi:hypothetical protein